jgi:RQC domain-containing protein
MSRHREQRVPYHLDSTGVRHLTAAEIEAILRGADMIIARGGRTQLYKLLKGSRETSVIEHGLDRCPSYGFYRELPIDEVLRRIDWMIEHDYLRIEYDHRLPVLVFTERGWAIEVETMADELLRGFDARLAAGPPYDFSDLKDRNRQLTLLLLDKIEASERREFIPLLQAWREIDYAKVRARIGKAIRALEGAPLA